MAFSGPEHPVTGGLVVKVKHHRAACNMTYRALYTLYMERQDADGEDPIPLDVDNPKVRDIMRGKPE
jgi:hypothetical protein